MADPEIIPLLPKPWSTIDHRVARAELERLGWELFAQGDWAYAFRSPSGRLAARVSPFEPAHGYFTFVELCERCSGNRYLPRVDLATPLEGGGHLAVLEYLSPADGGAVQDFLCRWEHPEASDEDLRSLRREVDVIDEWGRHQARGWVGVDIDERHVLRSADGNLKVLDLFGVSCLKDLIKDPQAFARSVPADRCRYLLDMPDLQLDDHPADYLRSIRNAFEKAFPTPDASG